MDATLPEFAPNSPAVHSISLPAANDNHEPAAVRRLRLIREAIAARGGR